MTRGRYGDAGIHSLSGTVAKHHRTQKLGSRALLLVGLAIAKIVIAVTIAVKNQSHQTAADDERDQDTPGNGDVAIKRDRIPANVAPCSGREPDGERQERKKRNADDKDTH